MQFNNAESEPGQDNELILKASPGSKFAVSVVDQSVKLLGKTNEIKEEDVSWYSVRSGSRVLQRHV